MRNNVYAVLLAGGKGTRLWPLSRPGFSKSFAQLGNRPPLIKDIIARLKGFVKPSNIVVVVDKAQERILRKYAGNVPAGNILKEPFGRSTASAIGLAAIKLHPEDVMAVLPTDSVVDNPAAFRKALKNAVSFAQKNPGALICIGIRPEEPSTAYGYMRVKPAAKNGAHIVVEFLEKPGILTARRIYKKAGYLWNAGVFVFKAGAILKAMEKHAPLLHRQLALLKKGKINTRTAYGNMKNISIDYQVMEKAGSIHCIKGDFSWIDIGSWKSAGRLFKKDKNGNVCVGKATLLDTRGSIVYNSEKKNVGVIGASGAIVVNTKEGLLVCGKEDAEKVKKLAAHFYR